MQLPAWQPEALESILVLLLCTIGFTVYHFLSGANRTRALLRLRYGARKAPTQNIFFQRYLGMISIGLLPAFVLWLVLGKGLSSYGVKAENLVLSFYWILGLGLLIIIINYFNTQNRETQKVYPMIREQEWTIGLAARNAISWIAYLAGYELMFRGILLFGLLPTFGVWPAIAVNAAIYAFAHVPKNLAETLGAIPLGIILCLITLHTGTIWAALFIHVTIALSTSFLSLHAHPTFKFVNK